jgi:hypothetical protein
MIPHTLVLEPGLRVHKIYNGYWFLGLISVEREPPECRAPHVPEATSAFHTPVVAVSRT